jgi:hypothetical protein
LLPREPEGSRWPFRCKKPQRCLWKREDDRERIIEVANPTKDGEPQTWKQGYFGLKGEPVNSTQGYHRVLTRRDREGRVLESAHLDVACELAYCSECGFYRALYRYDSRDNLAETLLLGRNGQPANSKNGWARKRTMHDGAGKPPREEFWKARPDGTLELLPDRK